MKKYLFFIVICFYSMGIEIKASLFEIEFIGAMIDTWNEECPINGGDGFVTESYSFKGNVFKVISINDESVVSTFELNEIKDDKNLSNEYCKDLINVYKSKPLSFLFLKSLYNNESEILFVIRNKLGYQVEFTVSRDLIGSVILEEMNNISREILNESMSKLKNRLPMEIEEDGMSLVDIDIDDNVIHYRYYNTGKVYTNDYLKVLFKYSNINIIEERIKEWYNTEDSRFLAEYLDYSNLDFKITYYDNSNNELVYYMNSVEIEKLLNKLKTGK